MGVPQFENSSDEHFECSTDLLLLSGACCSCVSILLYLKWEHSGELYLFFLFTTQLFLVLSAIGFVDFWVDFRVFFNKRAAEMKKKGSVR